MAHSDRETEIKLKVADPASARRLLRAEGFRVYKSRVFESNTVFDTSDLKLRSASSLLRVRQAGRVHTVTYKGPPLGGKHKCREELETRISNGAAMAAIIDRLGMRAVFRYEKYRTEFHRPGRNGIVTVDETPIGCYMELEGSSTWIDRTARQLGFAEPDYITASYGALYQQWRPTKGVKSADMVFR